MNLVHLYNPSEKWKFDAFKMLLSISIVHKFCVTKVVMELANFFNSWVSCFMISLFYLFI